MIVYRELSTLCHDLGFSSRALYSASNTIEKHYHDVEIPKGNGEMRLLHVPDKFIKSIQKSITRNLLFYMEISPYAVAYRIGWGTKHNASFHAGKHMIMKCDIRRFFDHITFNMLRDKVFSTDRYSENNSILLSILCTYNGTVPQGAPTSPAISNIILRDFDYRVGVWCSERNITYTRYCDDMTFSGEFASEEVKSFVNAEIHKEGFYLNDKKTVVLHPGQRMEVTGLVVNEKISVPNTYKRRIRQEIYYCQRNGWEEHLLNIKNGDAVDTYKKKLLGKVNYVLSIEPNNREMKEYKGWIRGQIDLQE